MKKTQREEQAEARKMDVAREQSESIVAEEQRMHKSSLNQILNSASIDEIIGLACNNTSNNHSNVDVVVNSSIYFPSSTLLTLTKVNNSLRLILKNDTNNIAREKILHLLTLEKKAFKWFGDVLPHAYFGITLPDRLAMWCNEKKDGNKKESYKQEVIVHQLQAEIDDIEHAMYSLSEQQQGHLGLMVPKKFIQARDIAIAKGLISNHEDDNVIILDD